MGIGCFWEQLDSIIEDSDGPRWRAHAACIRPVVILPADARTVDVAKIQGDVTENWDSSIPKNGKSAEKGCIGCAWYDIERWRQELIKKLKRTAAAVKNGELAESELLDLIDKL